MAKSERELVAEEILYRLNLPEKVVAAIIKARETELFTVDLRPGTRCYMIDKGFCVEDPETRKIELTELGTIIYYQIKIMEEVEKKEKEANGNKA